MAVRHFDRRPSVVIVTPALRDSNNGNSQTAARWRRLLAPHCDVRLTLEWPDRARCDEDAMLALHARRSAASIAAWSSTRRSEGLAVILTGTDLYRDIDNDDRARQSLAYANELVVLQERGVDALPRQLKSKARVIYQSTTPRASVVKPRSRLRVVMVGHLRAEKAPEVLFAAARLLHNESDIHIDHLGKALEPKYSALARRTENRCPNSRWLGGLSHEETRRRIQRAHLLVHTSVIEGGAHVVMEAVCSGTPVLASRIEGNVGMLGAGYHVYFIPGDASGLARMLVRCRDNVVGQLARSSLLGRLSSECARRCELFEPAREQASLLALIEDLA